MTDYNDKISLLIPAYLRGELTPQDKAKVELAAAQDPDIKADIEFQRHLRDTLRADQSPQPANELQWARLSRDIDNLDASEAKDTITTPIAANDVSVKPSKFWMGATAALALVAVGQFGLMSQMTPNETQNAQYVLVSEAHDGAQTKVVPNSQMLIKDMSRLLKSIDGQIVSGPNALGLYDIKFKTIDACDLALPTLEDIMDTVTSCS